MTSSCSSLATLPDRELLAQLESDVQHERQATARIIALLMEVDARKLYAQQSCSSLFTYCVQMLHLSEHAAYLRIEAARAARRFPTILERLADGSLTLTTIGLVAPHLTVANHLGVLDAARHKSKRDVEQLVACLRPLPDVAPAVRKLPTPKPTLSSQIGLPPADVQGADAVPLSTSIGMSTSRPIEIKPLAPERFKVQFTINRETHDKLRQVQDLLRHTVRDGDLAAIFDRALTALLVELSKAKLALTDRPRSKCPARSDSRHVPAAVKREVWRRDAGRCAFRGAQGRCRETGLLEFHHVIPHARGGPTTTTNIELRCRAHNVYEAEQQFGGRTLALWAGDSSEDQR